MLAVFSAAGFFVQTPSGPRKSGMPDSVEIPAPVRITIVSASRSQSAIVSSASFAAMPSSVPSPVPRFGVSSRGQDDANSRRNRGCDGVEGG